MIFITSCRFLKKLCKSGCDNYACRAYFPERQPVVKKDTLPLCMSEEHVDCPQYKGGLQYREARRRKELDDHCFFASNSICGKPEDWWCKGGYAPHKLYPVYDEDGGLVYSKEQLKNTCWCGDKSVYEKCPLYVTGMRLRDEDIRLRELEQSQELDKPDQNEALNESKLNESETDE